MNCTVLLPVHNAGSPLRLAIESILAQDEKDFELLIIDDRSTDSSAATIREYAAQDSRIRPIYHEQNRGLALTLNEGLQLARSELVARMDQDDESLPQRISTQLRFMRENPRVAVAGSFVYHMGSKRAYDRLVTLPTNHEEIDRAMRCANCIYHPSVMLRREAVLAEGGYRAAFKNAEDYDLWLRMLTKHRLANIPSPLLRYRFSTTGMTLARKWQQMYYVQMAILSSEFPDRSEEEIAEKATAALEQLGKDYFLEGVATGTVRELIALHLWRDAAAVLQMFSRQLPRQARRRVLNAFVASTISVARRPSKTLPASAGVE